MKRTTKFIALVVAILVLLAGCQGLTDTSWVFERGEQRLPAGLYILFINDAFMRGGGELIEAWVEWSNENPDQEEGGPPDILDMTPEEMFEVEFEGMRFYDWVVAEAQNSARRYFAVLDLLEKYDIESDMLQMALAMATARTDFQENEQFYTSLGIGENSVLLFYIHDIDLHSLFNGLYGPGGPYEVPQEELRAHFGESFLAGQELIFVKDTPIFSGDETEEEAAAAIEEAEELLAELRELAQEFLERLLEGEAFEQLQYEREMMFAFDTDGIVRQPPGTLDFIITQENEFFFNQAVLDGLPTLSFGEAGIFEDEWVIAVVRRLDPFAIEDATEGYMDMIVRTMRFDDYFLPMLDELGSTLPLRVNNAAVNRYTLANLMQS